LKQGKQLEKQGIDVYVGEETAYSTLGWFEVPVVITMVDRGVILAAETLIHELAHQRLYIPGDTAFNEAFATAVAQEGMKRWLQVEQPDKLPIYLDYLEKRQDFVRLLAANAEQLRKIYDENVDDHQKQQKKEIQFELLKQQYQMLKQQWGGDNRYDAWFDKPLNNARLALIGVYYDQVDYFVTYLNANDGDFERFYRELLLDKSG